MDFLDLAKKRYTVRKYLPKQVEQEKLDLILEAGRLAPTAVNYQPQRIIVLNTPENLEKIKQFTTFNYDVKLANLAKECADENKQRNTYFYNSPLALLVCYDNTSCWKRPVDGKESGETDATIVAVHMMMEATNLGLGTAWISHFDTKKAKELLNLPSQIIPVMMLLIGYADDYNEHKTKKSPKRYDIRKTVFYNEYKNESN